MTEYKIGSSNESRRPIRFGGSELGTRRHICGFFHNPDEEYPVLLPFIAEGLARGEKAFHVVDPKLRDDHLERLKAAGIDVTEAEKSGHLELYNWEEVYIKDGRFDLDRMLAIWQNVLDTAAQRGYALTRMVLHMEWALEEREGVSDLIEYEARFNQVHQSDRDSVICAYHVARFPGDIIMDLLRTHPMIIVAGTLQENPFFVPPDQFLRELRQRRAA